MKAKQKKVGNGTIITGDCIRELEQFPEKHFQLIIADPPYFQVLLEQEWDMAWKDEAAYIDWCLAWARQCHRTLRDDGLFYVFGQHGKREHAWIHLCSALCREFQFHDMIVWDRAVGYNERYDSFTPQYEMILVMRKSKEAKPYFDKDAVRIPYDEETIKSYMRDKRYKDMAQREAHLRKGKYATNILRVPSLKGSSKEKVGHPSQKPIGLISKLVASGSRPGDFVLDPFLGSGSTAEACQVAKRQWVGIDVDPAYVQMASKRILSLDENPELSL